LILCKSGAWGPDLARAFRQMAETGLPAEGLLAAEPDSSRWGTSTAS
ncbi:arginine repressor, partial [Cutibacterium avidum]